MSSRQLAAIMFIDIVGYTAMMQADEQKGIKKVGQYQFIVEREIQRFLGELPQQ